MNKINQRRARQALKEMQAKLAQRPKLNTVSGGCKRVVISLPARLAGQWPGLRRTGRVLVSGIWPEAFCGAALIRPIGVVDRSDGQPNGAFRSLRN